MRFTRRSLLVGAGLAAADVSVGRAAVMTQFAGQTGLVLGNSIVELGNIPAIIEARCGLTMVNGGIGGATAGNTLPECPEYEAFSGYKLMETITIALSQGQSAWTDTVVAANTIATKYNDDNRPIIARLRAVDFLHLDVMVLHYGWNDFAISTPIGTNSDMTPATFKGAWNIMLLRHRYHLPNCRLLICTPFWSGRPDTDLVPNSAGLFLRDDYVDAIIELCEEVYHVPVLDLYRRSGFDKNSARSLLKPAPDLVHPTPAGYTALGNMIASTLLATF